MADVVPIPKKLSDKLSSGYQIGSFCQCVQDLLYNSIDANAVAIAVRVDVSKLKAQIVDKADGIREADMQILGERSYTSKREDDRTFGFKGEFLASLICLCKEVIIESSVSSTPTTLRKHFTNGKLLSMKKAKCDRACAGTTITMKRVFYALPVRQKQHNPAFELELLIERITALSICFPNISFSLRNETNFKLLIQTTRTASSLETFRGLFHYSYPSDLFDAKSEQGVYEGVFMLGEKPCRNSALKFAYVNGRPVYKTRLHRHVEEELCKLFETDTSDFVYLMKVACPRKTVEVFDSVDGQTFLHFANWADVERLTSSLVKKCFHLSYEKGGKVEIIKKSGVMKRSIEAAETSILLNDPGVIRSKIVKCAKTPEKFTVPKEIAEYYMENEKIDKELTSVDIVQPVATNNVTLNENLRMSLMPNDCSSDDPVCIRNVSNLGVWNTNQVNANNDVQLTASVTELDVLKVDSIRIVQSILPYVSFVNQLEKKFLVCTLKMFERNHPNFLHYLLVFDQHAVSERIWLEALSAEHILEDGVASAELQQSVVLNMHSYQIRFVHHFSSLFQRYGLRFCNLHDLNALTVIAAPKCLLMKERSDGKHSRASRLNDDLTSLISQILEALKSTRHSLPNSWLPKIIQDTFNTLACRNAVKFGTVLTKEESQSLLERLAKCRKPFECAHGRPTVIPLADLSPL